MRHLLLCTLVGLLMGSVFAPPTRESRAQIPDTALNRRAFERDLRAAMQQAEIPGVVVVMVEAEEVVYLEGFGLDPAAPYHIGRVADTFITTALFQQAERGRFTLDRPITDIFPAFTLAQPEAASSVTLLRLMAHTAGLGGEPSLSAGATLTPEDFAGVTPTAFPGYRYSYCTRCYALLVTLLQDTYGQPFPAVLQTAIFDPLRMESSFVTEDGHVVSTPADMARFMSMQLQDGRWRDVQLLTPASIAAMHTARLRTESDLTTQTGLSWLVMPTRALTVADRNDERIVSAPDFAENRALMTLIPGYQRGILILSDQPTPGLDDLMAVALRHFADYTAPDYAPPADFSPLTGVYSARTGERVAVEAVGNNLRVTYNGVTSRGLFIGERVIRFEGGQLFFVESGRPFNAILTVNGVVTPLVREG